MSDPHRNAMGGESVSYTPEAGSSIESTDVEGALDELEEDMRTAGPGGGASTYGQGIERTGDPAGITTGDGEPIPLTGDPESVTNEGGAVEWDPENNAINVLKSGLYRVFAYMQVAQDAGALGEVQMTVDVNGNSYSDDTPPKFLTADITAGPATFQYNELLGLQAGVVVTLRNFSEGFTHQVTSADLAVISMG